MDETFDEENLYEGEKEITHNFLKEFGFSDPIRYWNAKWDQFSVYYKIEGYDCDILVRPNTQVVPNNYNAYGEDIHWMPADVQVEEFSDIETLKDHHTGHFQIFVNSLENHVATFSYQVQLFEFMSICECPLTRKT